MKYLAVPLLLLLVQTVASAQTRPGAATTIARGKYLVERIGLCADCHSPRDQQGQFVRQDWLKGAPILFKPTVPMPWAAVAPPIAGLPGWTDAAAIKFLTTGLDRNGQPATPPMPPYRFSPADAKAVVAYLKSLGAVSAAPAAGKTKAKALPKPAR